MHYPVLTSLLFVGCLAPTPTVDTNDPLRAVVETTVSDVREAEAAPDTAADTAPAAVLDATPPAPPTTPPLAPAAPQPLPASPTGALCGRPNGKLLDTILATPSEPTPVAARATWDPTTPPARLDLIEQRYGLLPDERTRLFDRRFVVLERLAYPTFADAFDDVYRSEVPLYVSADALLAAVSNGHESLVADIEKKRLAPLLDGVLDALHGALPKAGLPATTAADLDLYLTVARSLLGDAPVKSKTGVDTAARALVATLKAARGIAVIDIFGRTRAIDASAFMPRGYYQKKGLAPWFRAAMWVSRVEWNLVSRSCRSSAPGDVPDPRETPREVAAAVALARLVETAGVDDDLSTIDAAWTLLAGPREDVPLAALRRLARDAGIDALDDADGVQKKLALAIGDRYARTVAFHPMPEGTTSLPVIATLLGPRLVPDAPVSYSLAHDQIPGRGHPTIADVAYALGLDRARHYLAADLKRFPTLDAALAAARTTLAGDLGGALYGHWLGAIRGLARPTAGVVPSYMESDAFADLRLGSIAAAWAQLKHGYVLMAGQPYSEGGCHIPDAFVEPAPEVFDAIARYADAGRAALALLDKGSGGQAGAYLIRLGRVASALALIARRELDNRPLTPEMLAFLGNVVEVRFYGHTAAWATYDGWYFDLFRGVDDAFDDPALVADWFTDGDAGAVVYAGVSAPRLAAFVVDTAGAPRVVIGPVAAAYEHVGPLDRRLDDAAALKLPAAARHAPWQDSHLAPAPTEPDLLVRIAPDANYVATESEQPGLFPSEATVRVTVTGKGPARDVTVEILDHHMRVIATKTRPVADKATVFALSARGHRHPSGTHPVEGVRIRVGDFSTEVRAGVYGDLPDLKLGAFR